MQPHAHLRHDVAAGQLQGLLRTLEQQIDAEELPKGLYPLVEGCKVTADGDALRAEIDVREFDLEALLPELLEILR